MQQITQDFTLANKGGEHFCSQEKHLSLNCMISKYSHFSAGLEERLIEVKHSTNISNIHIFQCRKSLLFLLHDFISLDVRSRKWRKVYKCKNSF